MFEFLKRRNAAEDRQSPPLNVPAALQNDSDEPTEFGSQVVGLLAMQPDHWSISDNLREFSHPELGQFAFDANDRVQHRGTGVRDYLYGNRQMRVLSLGDHRQIVAVLQTLLSSAMVPPPAEPTTVTATATTAAAVYAQQQAAINRYRQQQLQATAAPLPLPPVTDSRNTWLAPPADAAANPSHGPLFPTFTQKLVSDW